MKNKILILCLFSFNLIYSQKAKRTLNDGYNPKVEILNQSGFQHEYIIRSFDYLEDIHDTARLKYIATLKITDKTFHYSGIVIRWLAVFQSTAKKLGADAFCLKEYFEKDSIGTLIINVYFAGENYLKVNKQKPVKNTICLFGELSEAKDSSYFYLNGSKTVFDRKKNYLINASINKEYTMAVSEDKKTITPVKFKKDENAKYFIVPESKKANTTAKGKRNPSNYTPSNKGVLLVPVPFGAAGAIIASIALIGYKTTKNVGNNTLIELKYMHGRFMSDVYK